MSRAVAVVGSGPAGLWAARYACENGARVTLLEARRGLSAKLLISGAGKCNYTNILSAAEQASKFGRNWRFMLKAMNFLPPEAVVRRLRQLGVESELVDNFYYFPASHRAADIRSALLMPQIDYRVSSSVIRVDSRAGRVCGVTVAGGEIIHADAVVLACGGISYPQLGGDMHLVYRAAELAGHEIVDPVPGLTGLRLEDYRLGTLAGMVLESAGLTWKFRRGRVSSGGILLFTHNGISGPAVLDISAAVSRALSLDERVTVKLKFFRDLGVDEWNGILMRYSAENGRRLLASCLAEHVTRKCADLLLSLAGVPQDRISAELSASERRALAGLLGGMELNVSGSEGWNKAMVTSGGVSVRGINPSTLESKLLKGLFFAGEMIDLDGPCGGYNIQWASSSGALAGYCAATCAL